MRATVLSYERLKPQKHKRAAFAALLLEGEPVLQAGSTSIGSAYRRELSAIAYVNRVASGVKRRANKRARVDK